MIEVMDRGVARLLQELRSLGLEQDTIVLFTSDNGPRFCDSTGGVDTTRFNCGFAGAKGSVYEGGIRVPMIVRWPAELAGGRVFDGMVHFVDWLPTLLAAAGVARERGLPLDGWNVLPALRGEPGDLPDTRFWQWNHYTPVAACNAAMRAGDWKLVRPRIDVAMVADAADWEADRAYKRNPGAFRNIIHTPEPPRAIPTAPPPQLFDIARDPLEQHDLASAEPARVDRMLAALEAWFEEVEAERRRITEHP
jgi:arylsulfatase A